MLKKLSNFPGIKGPVVTIVMDGFGITDKVEGNAIKAARTPTLDNLFKMYPNVLLKAHGRAVGMPTNEDMGNSEVGHNAIGAGQVYNQGAALVQDAIVSGDIFDRDAWKEIASNVRDHGSVLHFIGLFSDGNVHSNISHLKAMVAQAKKEGLKKVRVHILLDGRDVPETSA
ncbi:MAG: 2,3-bisphosphoglycerate-independent phosphoglycerate mutase, partial [Fibrobacter sp.]|nr:2,3-bisphosphoglycerate-independent phosphoglycerate mutase [Fibrobacter sp.]